MVKKTAFFFMTVALFVYIAGGSHADSSTLSQLNQTIETNQEYNNEMKSEKDEYLQEQQKVNEEMKREQEQINKEIQTENKEIKAEMEAENKQVKAEIEAERQVILKEFKTEREAMKALWDHRQNSTSINQQSYDITSHTNIDFNNQDLKTTGISIANTPDQIKKARQRAQQIALFKMQQLIEGIKPTNTETISEMEKKHPGFLPQKKINQLITRNAEKHVRVTEKSLPDGKKAIYVSVVTPMNGKDGVASLVKGTVNEAKPSPAITPVSPAQLINKEIEKENTAAIKDIVADLHNGKRFTGLVIDAKGIDYKPCLFPVIEDTQGRVIYGPDTADQRVVNSTGPVGWTREVKPARPNIRVGSDPLVLKAVGVKDGNILIVDNESAQTIQMANNDTNFLSNGRVVVAVR
ncbi:MAG: hypothetical protein ACP5JP_06940 [bacterium]